MGIDIDEIRRAAKCIHIAVESSIADDIDRILTGAASEIERLRGLLHDARLLVDYGSSSYISGTREDLDWDKRRDEFLIAFVAELIKEPVQ